MSTQTTSLREEDERNVEQTDHSLALAGLILKMDAISDRISELTNAVVVSTLKTEKLGEKIDKIQKNLLKR